MEDKEPMNIFTMCFLNTIHQTLCILTGDLATTVNDNIFQNVLYGLK